MRPKVFTLSAPGVDDDHTFSKYLETSMIVTPDKKVLILFW